MDQRRGQPALCRHLAERRGRRTAAALPGDLLRPRRYGKPHQGVPTRSVRRPHLGRDDARQSAPLVVCFDGLCTAVCVAPPGAAAHAIRQSDLRHNPPQAVDNRRGGAHQRAAHYLGDGLELPLSARLRTRPRRADQRHRALTKQKRQTAIFDPVNRTYPDCVHQDSRRLQPTISTMSACSGSSVSQISKAKFICAVFARPIIKTAYCTRLLTSWGAAGFAPSLRSLHPCAREGAETPRAWWSQQGAVPEAITAIT